jgi:uncharacterized membrane protein YjfL (UPF0719 family)
MEKYLMMLINIILVLVFLFISKKIADAITRFDDDAEISRDANLAVALRRFGIFTGICIAFQAVIFSMTSYADIGFFCVYGLVITIVFFVAHFINDYIIIHGVKNNDLIRDGNIPTGIIEAGAFIATGILVNGAFSGDEGGILSAVVFFFLGQVVMIAAIFLHQKIYNFNVVACVKENNASAGAAVSGLLIAYSIILRSSIAGNFVGWTKSLTAFFVSAIVGMISLIIFERIAAMIFLPKMSIRESIHAGNTAAIILVVSITIALSLIISRLIYLM